ncbi:hypothetical protein ACFQY4_39990 [Catellatospora bangladeshensis]|uniref:Uncharacterized protein n=1 Tax=Catellatospora bangladeshensis TaxID=310355 RepID=A0A8J3JU88_9ACTN|nr:hypothetical protein Cba03nite_52030 [Catellatospora bangladeshensis]
MLAHDVQAARPGETQGVVALAADAQFVTGPVLGLPRVDECVHIPHFAILAVAWTLGDLAGLDRPGAAEINIAFELRKGALT